MRTLLFGLIALVSACSSESVCPPGTHESGPICVLDDAGVDAGSDAATDAGADAVTDGAQTTSDSAADATGSDGCAITRFYRDSDGDGHGSASSYLDECTAPEGYVASGSDCDDTCRDCHPGATEICDPDNRDEDCSGASTEACVCQPGDSHCQWGCVAGTCNDVVEIGRGTQHACALRRNGEVVCFGYNYGFEFGGGSLGRDTSPLNYDLRAAGVPGLPSVRSLALGGHVSCAVTRDNRAWCWGSNFSRNLGLGTNAADIVTRATELPLQNVAEISVQQEHSCARATDGQVWCWGHGADGRLGSGGTGGATTPQRVNALTDVTDIDVGPTLSCAVRSNGELLCWGVSEAMGFSSLSPRLVPGFTDIARVEVGGGHLCAANRNGDLFCAGLNDHGQLGDTTTSNRTSPVRPLGLAAVRSFDLSTSHTCAATATGELVCFGLNMHGQLGDGGMEERRVPTRVPGATNARSVAVGPQASCYVATTSGGFCWGNGVLGQLGDGAYMVRPTPGQILPPL